MSQPHNPRSVPPVVRDRIRDDDSRIIERLVVLLLAFWMGGLLMVGLSATGSFSAVDSSLERPSSGVSKAIAKLGVEQTRDLLHYQSAEVNRHAFGKWGWLQLGLTGSILAALLFMTNTGKRVLGLSAGMVAISAFIALYLIPGMVRIGRQLHASPLGPSTDLSEEFRKLHQAFGAFEAGAVVLALLLMAALLRGGSAARR